MNARISYNKITTLLCMAILACFFLSSCEETETYAEQKKAERRAIAAFIEKGCTAIDKDLGDTLLHVDPIKVITEDEFIKNDSTTDVSKNEYVLFPASGLYMQIIRKGTGTKLQEGESTRIICRYVEFNVSGDSIQSHNNNAYYIAVPEEMTCTNSYGTLTGTFISGMMYKTYKKTTVPEAWLIPLKYVNIGRQTSEEGEIAKVRILVPHTIGQTNAVTNVYPCFYEITYQRGR